jgi:hypothetical protein
MPEYPAEVLVAVQETVSPRPPSCLWWNNPVQIGPNHQLTAGPPQALLPPAPSNEDLHGLTSLVQFCAEQGRESKLLRKVNSELVVSLRDGNRVIGVLSVGYSKRDVMREKRAAIREDLEALIELAAALALSEVRLARARPISHEKTSSDTSLPWFVAELHKRIATLRQQLGVYDHAISVWIRRARVLLFRFRVVLIQTSFFRAKSFHPPDNSHLRTVFCGSTAWGITV